MERKVGKVLAMLFTMGLMLMVLPTNLAVKAATINSGSCGENATWELDDQGILTINGTGVMNDYSVAKKAPWNKNKDSIKKIIIKGVASVGEYAFYQCKETEVDMSESNVEQIKYAAFSENDKLIDVKWPNDTLKVICKMSFDGCSLTELKLPESVEKLENAVFYSNSSVAYVYFPGGIKETGDSFERCSVTSVVYGEGIKSINETCRYVPSKRTELPSTIEYIDEDYFYRYHESEVLYGSNSYVQNYAYEHEMKYVDIGKVYDAENIKVNTEKECEYTGSEIKPSISATCEMEDKLCGTVEIPLFEGVDYTVDYRNNTDIGVASIVITGNGMFTGTKTIDFKIYGNIQKQAVELEYGKVLYDGKEKTPEVTVKSSTNTLVKDTDYTVTYTNNKNEGKAIVTVEGKGDYKGSIQKQFTIFKNDLAAATIGLSYETILYDGNAKEPSVSVIFEEKELEKDVDYKVTFKDNAEEGTAVVTINGLGSYKGSVQKQFVIYKYDIKKANVKLSYEKVLCDGVAKQPSVTVDYEGKTLKKNTDYTVEIKNNTMPGVAKVVITGKGQYAGVNEKSFTIEAISLEKADIKLKETIFSYDGSTKTPDVSVTLGNKTLAKNKDYKLSYENNLNDGTAHAVVTGIGMYTDVVKASFVILPYNAGMDAVYPDGTLIDGNYVYGVTDDEKNEVELCCPAIANLSKVQVPATIKDENGTIYTVTSIGQKAFYKNTKITSLIVGNNVKSIEDYAFYGCKNLKKINFGNGIEIIGGSSFRKCTKLTSVTLPKSIDELGKNAFYGCSKLKTITIKSNSVVDVSANAIKGISKKAVIKVPKKLVKKYKKEFDKKSGFKSTMKIKSK